jgi:tRNA(Arg) A34 adenosine deaminase TadA
MQAAPGLLALDHERYMRRAIERARVAPIALYQSVIVNRQTGDILAEGANDVTGDHPLIHGETAAIDACYRAHPGIAWSRLALYTTAEPCPMCQAAIGWAGIGLVVYGASTPFLATLGYDVINLRAEDVARHTAFNHCQVIGSVLEAECEALFVEWRDAHPEG